MGHGAIAHHLGIGELFVGQFDRHVVHRQRDENRSHRRGGRQVDRAGQHGRGSLAIAGSAAHFTKGLGVVVGS